MLNPPKDKRFNMGLFQVLPAVEDGRKPEERAADYRRKITAAAFLG
jgi:hypothetical protein